MLIRIDDKLIHSQMVWGWIPKLNVNCIIVANDEAAHNELRRKLLTMVVQKAGVVEPPPDVKILSLEEAARFLKGREIAAGFPIAIRSILVVVKPADVVWLQDRGVPIRDVIVGWMSFSPGKKRILETVSVDEEDIEAFRKLISKGVSVKYQASPSDVQQNMAELLGLLVY